MKVISQMSGGKSKEGPDERVAEGYARNFLLPKNLAVLATADAKHHASCRPGQGQGRR